MAEDGQEKMLVPPGVHALLERAVIEGHTRTAMERTISTDIREERDDLKKAAEQSHNAIMELDFEGKIRWVSPSWQDVTGMPSAAMKGKAIADLMLDNNTVFTDCVESMRKDDSKSQIVRFSIKPPASAGNESPMSAEEEPQAEEVEGKPAAEERTHLEGQGIMVYDRTSGQESHTMWMIKPAVSREITIDLPEVLVESLGIGAEMLANYLTLLADVGVQDPENHPPPLPVLCRICERQITPWWFEKHTELCSQEHRAEMEVQFAQESLTEHRSLIVKVLDALEAHARHARSQHTADAGSPTPAPLVEYKGLAIGPTSQPPSGLSSGRASPAAHQPRSQESSSTGLSHHRARSFAVRRPLARIVELVLDLCDTAMEISTPAIKDNRIQQAGELRTQSPQSEGRITQVLQWQSPSVGSLGHELGMSLLCDDTSNLAKAKVEAIFRHRRILEYSERIRMEYDILVQECISEALDKAARIAAGDLSDSSDDSTSSAQTPEQQLPPASEDVMEPMPTDAAFTVGSLSSLSRPSAMSTALRNASDPAVAASDGRASSVGGSSRSDSPHGCKTPKLSTLSGEPFPLRKRGSIAFESSDAGGDSDSSMRSSTASGPRRAGSPGSEASLSRVVSSRSRDRKRKSLILPSLAASSRHQSPARGPPPPSSPLRMAKARITSGADGVPSPITSPVLATSGFSSPVLRAQHHHRHHRRQSSTTLSDAFRGPTSPGLTAVVSNPQPRAVQTSIKDFEIIKPISKGAFGSVYLSKKKSTGDYYAIKVLKKADMVAKNQVTNVKAERAIMMWQGESDFVAKLYWTFSSKDYLYLVMEYLNGGDCASLIKVLGGLPEDWTKKYVAEVVLGVQHLHHRQIVHRDLKPDNLLIDAKGHLKLTDFGLSRMGLIGRQKRVLNSKPSDMPPDLLKQGPFGRAVSIHSSRSASFDFHGTSQSPAQTPNLTPAFVSELGQPSYFSLNREGSRELSRRTSGQRSDSGDSEALNAMFRRFSVADGRTPIEEETYSEDGDSPDPYVLHAVSSHSSNHRTLTPPPISNMPPPPPMALFDPQDSQRRFVGTPDYLAPETINGAGQDEMSDWWSLGCILFECLYGHPPFNADTPEDVFKNILARNIHWPSEDEDMSVDEEAKDLMNKLMCLDPKKRLGSNLEGKYASGGDEIRAHPWFKDIHWETLREDEASFVPTSGDPEDTEYFDSRGATMENFAAEFEDQAASPAPTPGTDYQDRPHDALSRVRSQINAVKRNLMPLHIPPHVRDARNRRLSEPVVADDFGNFQFKNLPVLEKANKDVIQKLRADAMQPMSKPGSTVSSPVVASPSPVPSLESSPVLPLPLRRTLSANKGNNRPASPSMLSQSNSSPSRGSQPSSPLLVSFSTGQNHERRKTSSGSSSLSHQASNSLQPGNVFDAAPRLPISFKPPSVALSPIKTGKSGTIQIQVQEKSTVPQRNSGIVSPRQRSQTVGSQDGDLVPDMLPNHHKRRSQVFEISPSSSDTEETRQKALIRVQRRRQSSRRMSQISLVDGPTFRTLDVLVCEDHPVSRLVMERLLEKLRCRTIAAHNGSEAMRYAMSEVKFDIIMMEYKLPQVNGADVARMIRDTKNANSHTPIVAVTGYLKELQAPHHFDALVEKPPTKEKLEEVMGRLCQWKAPGEFWKPNPPQAVPLSSLRHHESIQNEDSPTTTGSSGFGGFPAALSSSYRGSSREDSIGSSSFGENDSHFESIPVIISRQPTNEWQEADLERNFGGLGISSTGPVAVTVEPNSENSLSPPTQKPSSAQTSEPSIMDAEPPHLPRKQPSMEAIQAKRKSIEKGRHESAESGDDEDEELGNVQVRRSSPKRHAKRSSKLGTEMMRTNSQGSVISSDDLLAAQTFSPSIRDPTAEHVIAEDPAEDVGYSLTPPEFFPRQPGTHVAIINMDADTEPQLDLDATPKPHHTAEPDPDPTPRAERSPTHPD